MEAAAKGTSHRCVHQDPCHGPCCARLTEPTGTDRSTCEFPGVAGIFAAFDPQERQTARRLARAAGLRSCMGTLNHRVRLGRGGAS
jgi:hypothetical protein